MAGFLADDPTGTRITTAPTPATSLPAGTVKPASVPDAGDPMVEGILAGVSQTLGALGLGAGSDKRTDIIPLWMARPKGTPQKASRQGLMPGEIMPDFTPDPTSSSKMFTKDAAASAFLDMDDKAREQFREKAIASGLVDPADDSPSGLLRAWTQAVGFAADYNGDRTEGQWISPWEAVDKLGGLNAAGKGGAYDPFKPRTETTTTAKSFLSGDNAESVTRNLESMFASEMGRAPTAKERTFYQKLVQDAYNKNPEIRTTTQTPDKNGNVTTNTNVSGGVDTTATLLDSIRDTPEADSFQAGVTFFQAAMQALGAIA